MNRKASSIIITAIVILSVVIVSNTTIGEYEVLKNKTPGVDIFEGGSETLIGAIDTNDVIKTDMDDIFYGKTMSIEVNECFTWTEKHYLYYPEYTGKASSGDYVLKWIQWEPTSGPAPSIDGIDLIFENVELNYSGLWLIGPESSSFHPDASVLNNMSDTIPAWFWVNGTDDDINVRLSKNSIYYKQKINISINVTKDDEPYTVLIDVRDDDNISIFDDGDYWAINPVGEFTFSTEEFEHAGEYKVYVYRDIDDTKIFYNEIPGFYNDTYGKDTINIEEYNYTLCGPWDPPEYYVEPLVITVETAEPLMNVEPTTIYWGFESKLYVNVTSEEGNGIDNVASIKVKNKHGDYIESRDAMNITLDGDYTISFARGANNWSQLNSDDADANGTWYVCFGWDINDDSTEEWNNSVSFSVRDEAPGVLIDVTNDGEGDKTDMKINIIQQINDTVQIDFTIFGKTISDKEAYFGDDPVEETKESITISGDILYDSEDEEGFYHDPILENNYDGVNHPGEWTALVTPMRPGEIEISIDWEGSGTDTAIIEIVNGTYVDASIDSFFVDENVTFTVTVKNINNALQEHALVELFWKDGTPIKELQGDGSEEKGKDGIYKFTLDTDDTVSPDGTAPYDIIVKSNTPGSNYLGFDKITMEANHDIVVTCNPTESYAGNDTEYDIKIKNLDGNEVDDAGLTIELHDEDNEIVKDKHGNDITWNNKNDIENEEIILSAGTYHFYAYNNTHDSKGNNATIIIHSYTVNCSPTVLAWLIDTEMNVTFNVTPVIDGTLKIINVTDEIEGETTDNDISIEIPIEDGVGTIEKLNASTICKITFEFKPTGGRYEETDGTLKVTTATATPNPSVVYISEPITVTVTITHPETGMPISDVEVGLQSNILVSPPGDETTDSNGQVQFGITTGGSGDITILIEGDFDPDNEFVIESKLRKTMVIDTPLTVNEGQTFTVNIKTLTGDLVTDLVTIEFADDTFTTSTGTLQLTSPMVSTDTDYRIRASATGYYNDEDTIRVKDKPDPEIKNLNIIIYEFTGKGKTKFNIVVIDDTGRSITGVVITFNGKEYITTADGVDLITPNEKGSYEITASFTGYESSSKSVTVTEKGNGTPGFELLTLVVALGVCFILLKRRRK